MSEHAAELRWFRRLQRVLKDMPDTVEIQVHQNTISLVAQGAFETAFAERGDCDNVEEISFFQTRRVRPCSESL